MVLAHQTRRRAAAVVADYPDQLGIALLEYCLVVPANHFGAQWGIKPFQLKIMQEVVTLCIFALFAALYLNEKITLNYLLSFTCVLGAVYFAFKK